MSLCGFPFGQLARLIHRLCQIPTYFVCPDIHGVEMDIVHESLAKIEEVMTSSTAACRIFHMVERLEDSNHFDAELFTKELPIGFEERVAVLRASVDEVSAAEEKRKCQLQL